MIRITQKNKNKSIIAMTVAFTLSLLIIGGLPSDASAQMSKKQKKEIKNVTKLTNKASKAFKEIMAAEDKAIPKRLLRDAKAVAVFPNVVKAAFGFGGRGGKGLISRKLKSGWSAPAVYKFGGGSAGFQIGASSTDLILLFMTDNSLKNFLEDKFEIGASSAAAAGPVGRSAEAGTNVRLKAQILSYSRSKGLFAGISIEGAVISADNDANQAVYNYTAKELLMGVNKVAIADIPDATKGFQETLTEIDK
jgi:lipid-binding SYLF domain-containing protein